jgi:predicted negative regulator of RcsB-dependent stress response
MCIICLELEKLTTIEAINNLKEIEPTIGDEHLKDLTVKLMARMMAESVNDYNHAMKKLSKIINNRFDDLCDMFP